MNARNKSAESMCPREEIFYYLDGELPSDDERGLELHLANCKACTDELNAQKKLTNSLELILDEEMNTLQLPENFSKVAKVKAEGHVSGLRHQAEIGLALVICIVLIGLVTYGYGMANDSMGLTFERIAEKGFAVTGFAVYSIYETAIALSVIARPLCRRFLFNSLVSISLILAVFVIASLSLSRLVLRNDRS